MSKYFIFLEVLDPQINGFFWTVQNVVHHREMKRAAHLTIRGPYDQVPHETLKWCRDEMQYDVLRIADVDRFSNPNEETVFFRVDSPNLRKVWYKPDFTIERYGFNPHFSIYRGRDARYADLITDFIRSENIELLCAEFRIVSYLSAQAELLPDHFPISKGFPLLLDSGRVREGFVNRLQDVVKSYRPGKQGGSG